MRILPFLCCVAALVSLMACSPKHSSYMREDFHFPDNPTLSHTIIFGKTALAIPVPQQFVEAEEAMPGYTEWTIQTEQPKYIIKKVYVHNDGREFSFYPIAKIAISPNMEQGVFPDAYFRSIKRMNARGYTNIQEIQDNSVDYAEGNKAATEALGKTVSVQLHSLTKGDYTEKTHYLVSTLITGFGVRDASISTDMKLVRSVGLVHVLGKVVMVTMEKQLVEDGDVSATHSAACEWAEQILQANGMQ